MSSLESAIVARAGAHSGLNALISGRVYDRRAPQQAARPYVVFEQIGGPGRARSMNNGATLWAARVQFNVIASTTASEIAVHEQLLAAFDWLGRGTYGGTDIELGYAEGGRTSVDSVQVMPDLRESSQDFIFHYRVA